MFVCDDGRLDDYTVMRQIFVDEGVPCTSAVVTSFVGNTNYMTIGQLNELKSLGWCICSHTHSHVELANISATEAENEIRIAKEWLNSNGFDGDLLVYPYGSVDQSVRNIARKYCNAAVDITEGYNELPLYQYQLKRKGAWEDSRVQSYSEYLEMVDTAKANNYILIFKLHSRYTNFNPVELKSLIQYIKGKGIEIITLRTMIDRYQNILDIGDYNYTNNAANYTVVSTDGQIKTDQRINEDFRHNQDITGIDNATPITDFKNGVTISVFTYPNMAGKGFPETYGSVLETYRFKTGTSDEFSYQILRQYLANGPAYKRTWNQTDSMWNPWYRIDLSGAIQSNIIISKQTVTIPTLTADGKENNFDVTIEGIDTSWMVDVSPSGFHRDIVFTAYCHANNTVRVKAYNMDTVEKSNVSVSLYFKATKL